MDYLIDPVFHYQIGDECKVANVSRNQRGSIGKRDTGNEQIGSTDFANAFESTQSVEMLASQLVDSDDAPLAKQSLTLVKPVLRSREFTRIRGFQQ